MSRLRRDPRAERAGESVQGAARPRFERGRKAPASASPSGRLRRDPRAERHAAAIQGSGARPRFDWTHTPSQAGIAVAPSAAMPAAPASAPVRRVRVTDQPAFLVYAVLDAPEGRLSRFDRQVLGAARLLADAGGGGGAVVALAFSAPDECGAAGADRILDLGRARAAPASERARLIAALVGRDDPRHVLFPESGDGGDLARRLSVALGETLLTDVEHLTPRQAVRASKGRRAEEAGAPPRLMTLGEDRAAAYEGDPCEARALETGIEAPVRDAAILSEEIIPGDPAKLSLSETDFVVSAGNGVTDFDAFRALAAAMKGTPGASRVVCDAGLMPRAAQVGASGTVLAADCYLALGIAGAPQHLQGIAGCEHVIAVNTDLHAAMIERAGLAIVQDAQLVMPALSRLLKARQGEGETSATASGKEPRP